MCYVFNENIDVVLWSAHYLNPRIHLYTYSLRIVPTTLEE